MRFIPVIFFLLVAVLLVNVTNMADNPKLMPNMIGKQIEQFEAPELFTEAKITSTEITQSPAIINIFASWCVACKAEHPQLMAIKDLNLYGLDSGDKVDLAKAHLAQMGNPYKAVIFDPYREIAIKLGSTGTPETFVTDKGGKIYFHYRGNLTDEILNKQLLPIYNELVKRDIH